MMLFHNVPSLFTSSLIYEACLFEHNVYIKSDMSHSEGIFFFFRIDTCCTIAYLRY